MLAIRLPAEVEARLEALARATGRTKTFYVREAILEHLGDLEDLYFAEQRLIDIRAGKTQTVPLEEVMAGVSSRTPTRGHGTGKKGRGERFRGGTQVSKR